jgi:SAM-dependent methyltransferase
LFWVYFVNVLWPRLPQGTKKLLHAAPEPYLADLLRSCDAIDYLSGDLAMLRGAMIKLDLTDIRLPDSQFDVIICSHVLEHIPDDRKAMAEMFRVTKPGGFLLVMVPTYGRKTYEDFSITSRKDRRKHFGQEDHVRKYGMDIVDRLAAAGFKVTAWPREGQLDTEIAKFIAGGPRVIFECHREP